MPSAPGIDPPLNPFASESRMRQLVERLPVIVYVDSDDRVPRCLYIGPHIERILGVPAERILSDREIWRRMMHPDDRDRVRGIRDEAWERGLRFRAEYRMVRPDGHEVWLRDTSMVVLSDEGDRLAWQGVLEDLTHEKQSEEDAHASEARYRALVERVPAVVYEMDQDDERRTLYVSPHVEDVLGYTRAEWLEQPDIWIELLHVDDREVVLAHHDRHSETGEPWDLEYRLIANDGRVVWVHDRATLIRGRDRTPTWHGIMIDVTAEHEATAMLLLHKEDLERRVAERTAELREANELMSLEIGERRRMERELRQVEARYRELVENMPGIGYLWNVRHGDPGRHFDYVSPRVEDVLGFAPDEWNGADRVHPHDAARVEEAAARSARTGEPFAVEYRFLAKDGRVVWVLDHASLVTRGDWGEPSTFQGLMLDVTGTKEAESKAAAAEGRFRALAERGPMIAYEFDLVYGEDEAAPVFHLSYISPQAAELVGYPVEHWTGDLNVWFAMMHPDDRDRVEVESDHIFRTGTPWSMRYRMIRSDGSLIWLLDTGRMLERDALGRPRMFQGVLIDVTAHEEDRVSLESSEGSVRRALEGVLAIPWSETIDPTTGSERYTYIGPLASEILGYSPEELMGEPRHFLRMVHPDDRKDVRASVARSDETGIWEATYRVLRRDGGIRWLHSVGRRVSPPREVPELWHGLAIDVTAVREAADESMPSRSDSEREF
jgi:PAS domain S-box-containing protein